MGQLMSYHIFDYTTHTINRVLHDLIDESDFVYEIEKLMGLLPSQNQFIQTNTQNIFDGINKVLQDVK
jgi:hypothetical protein